MESFGHVVSLYLLTIFEGFTRELGPVIAHQSRRKATSTKDGGKLPHDHFRGCGFERDGFRPPGGKINTL